MTLPTLARRLRPLAASIAVVLASPPFAVVAAPKPSPSPAPQTWTNTATSGTGISWFTAGNWRNNAVPGSGSLTTVGNGGTAQVDNTSAGPGLSKTLTISDISAVQVIDGKTLTVSGGITLSEASTLQIGSSTSTGKLSGNVNLNSGSQLAFANSSAYSGAITGSGNVSITGGTVSLTGNNTFQGGLVVSDATLEVAKAGNLGTGGLTIIGGTLMCLGNVTTSLSVGVATTYVNTNGYNAVLSGELVTATEPAIVRGIIGLSGPLIKTGAGTLFVTNSNNSFNGNTYVEGGTLNLSGNLPQDVIVGNQPTGSALFKLNAESFGPLPVFGGTGFIDGNLSNQIGTVNPGPGTLHVGLNYTQMAGTTLQIGIGGYGATQFGQLAIQGTAALAGTVKFIDLGNFDPKAGSVFIFLTAANLKPSTHATTPAPAGSVTGIFTSVLDPSPLLAGKVIYLPNAVELVIGPRPNVSVVAAPTLAELEHTAPAELSAIYEIGIGTANVQAFNLSHHLEELQAGVTGFSAAHLNLEYDKDGKAVASPDGKSGKDAYAPTPDNPWSVFLSGSGEFLDISGDSSAHGYDITTGGFTLGVDYRVNPNFAIGLLTGYAGTGANLTSEGHIFVDSGKFGLYATWFNEHCYVNGLVSGGYNSYDIRRGTPGGLAYGSTQGGELNTYISTGYNFTQAPVKFGPFAEFQYTYVSYDGYQEHGFSPLNVLGDNSDSIRSRLGGKVSTTMKVGGFRVSPELRVSWQHEFGDTTRPTESALVSSPGDVFHVEGPYVGRDSLIVNAILSIALSDRWSTYLGYDGQLARRSYQSNTVSGGVVWQF